MADIANFIKLLDENTSSAMNELKIVTLQQAAAYDTAQLILKVISDSIVVPTNPAIFAPSTTGAGTPGGGFGAGQTTGGPFGAPKLAL